MGKLTLSPSGRTPREAGSPIGGRSICDGSRRRSATPTVLLALSATLFCVACAVSDRVDLDSPTDAGEDAGATVVQEGSGGVGSGGNMATGGLIGSGGIRGSGGVASGGSTAAGGVTGTGGFIDTGGTTGTGGLQGSGGTTSTGGMQGHGGTMGSGGGGGRGGATGTGGIKGTGGATGSGGVRGTGGSIGSGGKGGSGAGGAPAPTFSQIYTTILTPSCSGSQCHNPGSQRGITFASQSSAYSSVKGLVTAGNASGSSFYVTVNSGQMPPGGPKLSTAALQMLAAWINAGALND